MNPPTFRARSQAIWLAVLIVAVTGVIAAIDLTLPLGYNISFLYVAVVLLAGLYRRPGVVTAVSLIALTLTLVAPAAKEHPENELPLSAIWFARGVAGAVVITTAIIIGIVIARDRDATELGRALKAAERQRELDRRMLDAASNVAAIGTWSINSEDDRFDWSPTAAEIHGYEPGFRPTRHEVLDMFDPEDSERLRGTFHLAWKTGEPFREELRVNLPDGSQRWIVKMGKTIRTGDNKVAQLHGTVQDISRWKGAEEEAQELTNRFAQFAAVMPIIIWTADPRGRIEYFNQTLMDYAGVGKGELLGDDWVDAVDPRDLDRVKAAWEHSIATGDPYDIEYRVKSATGTFEWHHLAAQAEYDEMGSIIRWWGSSVNVDATRKLREEADRLAAEREAMLESMSDGMYSADEEWRFMYVNASAERLLNTTRDKLIGRGVWDVYPTGQGSDLQRVMKLVMATGHPARLEFHSDLLDKWLDMSITRSPAGITVFMRDVTEVRKLSEQLAQSQRLESVGRLTGGVAHDFNNVLTVVLGGADAVLAEPDLPTEAREMAQLVVDAAQRGAELTNRLLAFARKQPLQPKAVSPFDLLTNLAPLLHRTLGENIDLVVAPHVALPNIEVDPSQLENALLNLTINARDAMPHGGKLTVDATEVTLDEGYVTAHSEVEPGSYVVITVTDSGTGIEPSIIDQLFDPFFTTKAAGKGSGLGLAMVWGFVKQSGGSVTVYSEMGVGTAFNLYFPITATAAHVTPQASPQLASMRGTGTILLAEDDDLVRLFATNHLRSLGYTVYDTPSGPEALERLETLKHIDLLFTDVIMPGGLTGRDLADEVLRRRPGTPVLYASGYTENVILHNGRLDEGVELLAKPYSARQLGARVHDMLVSVREGDV